MHSTTSAPPRMGADGGRHGAYGVHQHGVRLAGRVQRPHQGLAIGTGNRRFAGAIHLGQQRGIGQPMTRTKSAKQSRVRV